MPDLEKIRESKRAWKRRNREKVLAYQRKYLSSERMRSYFRQHKKRPEVLEKLLARNMLYASVKSGKIIRPSQYSGCKKRCKPEAHHHKGYENPLKVQWLCRSCHVSKHKE